MKTKLTVRDITFAALVGALYVTMCYFGNIFGLTFGIFQFRFAEALTVLPFLCPTAACSPGASSRISSARTACRI